MDVEAFMSLHTFDTPTVRNTKKVLAYGAILPYDPKSTSKTL